MYLIYSIERSAPGLRLLISFVLEETVLIFLYFVPGTIVVQLQAFYQENDVKGDHCKQLDEEW